MDKSRILVGCVTYEGHREHVNILLGNLEKLGLDAIIVDNSVGEEYAEELRSRGLKVIRDTQSGKMRTRIQRIIDGRNLVRKHFLEAAQKHDHLLFIDTDVTLPANAVDKLLECDADISTGVYICNQEINGKTYLLPTIYRAGEDEGTAVIVKAKEIIPESIFDVAICGLGCALIKREVLEKIKFRPMTKSVEGGEDVAFCTDARKEGFSIRVNTAVKCTHRVKLSGRYVNLEIKGAEGQ